MQIRTQWLVAAALPFILSVSLAQAQGNEGKAPHYDELPNFQPVGDRLFRGGQPKPGGYARLARLGVKTVVNLRDDDERARSEGEEARAAGLRYYNVPFGRLGRPSDAEVERVLRLIGAPENQPVFVHCQRGADRTGLVVAVYRMTHDGWTAERAQEEANRLGMGRWQLAKKDYIKDFYRDHLGGGAPSQGSGGSHRRPAGQ
jgi:protein tyrosine/serine phosphatase